VRATTLSRAVDSGQTALNVPRVEFVSKWHHGLTPAQAARTLTGRDLVTGELTLGVSIRNRHNGVVRFECDLWRVDLDFHPDALLLLADRWQRENAATPKRMLMRMAQHFGGRTCLMFDVMREHVCGWRDLLTKVLSDPRSFKLVEPAGPEPTITYRLVKIGAMDSIG
jgi:hypothetical protein